MKVIFAALGVLIAGALIFLVVAGLLWWLVPAAFLVPFTFPQALALTGILLLVGVPTMSK